MNFKSLSPFGFNLNFLIQFNVDFVSTNSVRRGILSTEQRWPSLNQLLLYETIK